MNKKILLISVLMLFLMFNLALATPTVADWRFDEGSGSLVEDFVSGHNGSFNGDWSSSDSLYYNVSGSDNVSGVFASDSDWVEISDHADFNLANNNFTWRVWLEPNFDGANHYVPLVVKRSSHTLNNDYGLWFGDSSVDYDLMFIYGSNLNFRFTDVEISDFPNGVKQLLTITREGNNFKVYINESLKQTVSSSVTFGDSSSPLKIGAGNDPTEYAYKYNGQIWRFKWDDYALNQTQVTSEYNYGVESLVVATLEDVSVSDSNPSTSETVELSVTCVGGTGLTGYTQRYLDGVISGSVISNVVSSGVSYNLYNLTNSLTYYGDVWAFESWCGDDDSNSSKTNVSVYVNGRVTGSVDSYDSLILKGDSYTFNASISSLDDTNLVNYSVYSNATPSSVSDVDNSLIADAGHQGMTVDNDGIFYSINGTNGDSSQSIRKWTNDGTPLTGCNIPFETHGNAIDYDELLDGIWVSDYDGSNNGNSDLVLMNKTSCAELERYDMSDFSKRGVFAGQSYINNSVWIIAHDNSTSTGWTEYFQLINLSDMSVIETVNMQTTPTKDVLNGFASRNNLFAFGVSNAGIYIYNREGELVDFINHDVSYYGGGEWEGFAFSEDMSKLYATITTPLIYFNISYDYSVVDSGSLTGEDDDVDLSFYPNANNFSVYVKGEEFNEGVGSSSVVSSTMYLPATTTYFTITASNIGGESLDSFSALVDTTLYETTNGTIITTLSSNASSLSDVIVFATDYYNETFNNYNVSSNLVVTDMYQLNVFVYAKNVFVNESVSYTNASDDLGQTENTVFFPNPLAANKYSVFKSLLGVRNYTVYKSSYYEQTQSFNLTTALTNTSVHVLNVHNAKINLTAIENLTNASLTNFNVSLIVNNESFNYNTTTNNLEIGGLSGLDYDLTFSKSGYASTNDSLTSLNSGYTNLEFQIYDFNSVIIKIYDFETESLIDDRNVSISVISDVLSFQNVTSEGFLNINFLTSNSYELRFNVSGYNPTSSFITVLDDSAQIINIYLSKNESSGIESELQTFQVVDTSNGEVVGAVVTLQKQLIGGSTTYITIQQATTNQEGKVSFWVVKSVNDYYRQSVAVDGETKPLSPSGEFWTTSDFFIPSITDTQIITIDLSEESEVDISNRFEISSRLSYNDTSNAFIYEWVDPNSVIEGGRLVVTAQSLDGYNEVIISNQSLEGYDGLISKNITPVNNSIFRAKTYLIWSGSEELDKENSKTFEITQFVSLAVGLILSIIVLMVVFLLTVKFGGLVAGLSLVGATFMLTQLKLLFIANSLIMAFIGLVMILFIKVKEK